ncbi:MAG: hypothetical protein UX89_C0009G0001 [Parcubacteria group bacterium GW2011_GWA2_47_16]|nr:MAG: hypothetical protein UX89_C0009G0001 [Parcubacteria group bacterium GW2011_GWA2_47_16]
MPRNEKTVQIRTKHGLFTVAIWHDIRDKAYLVKGVGLPDVVTFGKTLVEAKRMAADALELYCDCTLRDGKLIVDDNRHIVGKLPKSNVLSLA